MADFLLGADGDIQLTERGDVIMTDSVEQNTRIRIRWIKGEWRFDPEAGVDYYGSIFVKNPDVDTIQSALREAIEEVDEVEDIGNVEVEIDSRKRTARVTFDVITSSGEVYNEEVEWDA